MKTASQGRIHVQLLPGWTDITAQVGGDGAPFTLARSQGLGALQLSLGVQRAGRTPTPTPKDLLVMGHEIAAQRGLHAPLDEKVELAPTLQARLTYQAPDAFICLWVRFDGREFVAASYVCGWDARDVEIHEAELLVRSVTLR